MEKSLSTLLSCVVYLVVGLLLTASVGGAIIGQPLLLSVIRSNSMYPLFQRGDAVLISKVKTPEALALGDIIIFKCPEGSLASKGWIMHRIVDGNLEQGFITQGDANDYTDQSSGDTPPIKGEWIVSQATTIGNTALKIPLIGYIPLWLEGLQTNPMLLPGIAFVLAAVVGASELLGAKKRRRSKNLEQQLLYFFSGITLAIILGTSMLATSQHLRLVYEVSEASGGGVMMGSPVGILELGDTLERDVAELNNQGFFPMITTITTSDPQITFSHELITLSPGDMVKPQMTVTATEPGQHEAKVAVGMFLPLLPPAAIYFLAEKSYWLALGVTSFLPALPLILYPVLEPRLRRKTKRELARTLRRLGRYVPFS